MAWWTRLANERGQTLNPLSFLNQYLLRPVLSGVGQGLTQNFLNPQNLQQGIANLLTPQNLLGAGLMTAGALQREPGERTEARQFLRNRFTSPTALSEQFAGQIGGLAQQFQPQLTQQRQQDIAEISQRFAAAFPKTVGAQGPEFGTLSRYITQEALPREQGLLGNIGLNLLGAQERAATSLLKNQQPNFLAQGLGQLGGSFLSGGQGQFGQGTVGQGGQLGQGGQNPLSQLFGGGGQGGTSQIINDAVSALVQGGMPTDQAIQLAGQLLAQGVPFGRPEGVSGPLLPGGGFFSGTAALGRPEGVSGPLMQSGQFFSGAGGTGGTAAGVDFGLAGPGLLGPAGFSSLQGVASGVGSAGLGYVVGRAVSDWIERPNTSNTQLTTTLGGAAGGAAAGFAVGGPIGAVIGALAGGFAGFGAESRREDAQTAAETQATAAQRPAAVATGEQLAQSSLALRPATQQALAYDFGLRPRLEALIGTPALSSLLQQAQGLAYSAQDAGAPTDTPATPTGIMNMLRMIDYAVANGQRYLPGAGGPESAGGLLQSSETGKFGPGVELLQKTLAQFTLAQQLFAQVQALAGGG